MCLDRGGLVGEDGPTHHGAFDMAALRPIPNLTIASPMDERELRRLMYTAQLPGMGTVVLRYPRGRSEHREWRCVLEPVTVGTGRKIHEGHDVAVLTIGPIGNEAERAISEVEAETASRYLHTAAITDAIPLRTITSTVTDLSDPTVNQIRRLTSIATSCKTFGQRLLI